MPDELLLRTCRQVALSNLVGILHNGDEVLARVNGSVVDGRSCKRVAGAHTVCFFPCMRYNYCHADQSCCTDPRRLPVSLTTLDELLGARVKVRECIRPCSLPPLRARSVLPAD